MEKTFTLDDLKLYFREVQSVGKQMHKRDRRSKGPSKLALQTLLSYSRALEVLKTNSAGTFFQLAN